MYIRSLILALPFILLAITSLHASDISRDVREGRSARLDDNATYGGYLEFSAALVYTDAPVTDVVDIALQIDIGGHFRYKRFFVDALAESYNQIQLGYNVYSGKTWSVDWLTAISDHGIDSELSEELSKYTDRSTTLNTGLRATGYSGPYIFQFEAMQDISEIHDGHLITAYFARNWLRQNWNLHALLGARYESEKALDYQYGLDVDEANDEFPAYQAKSGTTYVAELGATLPLNTNLVFKATARHWELPNSIANSPLITDDGYFSVGVNLTYVY